MRQTPGRRRRPDPEALLRRLRDERRRQSRCHRPDLSEARLEGRELAAVTSFQATARPQILRPPNGQYVAVQVTGSYTVAPGSPKPQVNFQVVDEYRIVQPSGNVKSQAVKGKANTYKFTFKTFLQATVAGNDSSGRQYSLSVAARDNTGSGGVSIGFVVPQPGAVVVTPTPTGAQAQRLAARGLRTR